MPFQSVSDFPKCSLRNCILFTIVYPSPIVGEVNKVRQRWPVGLKQTLVSSLETPPLVSSSFAVRAKTPTDMEAVSYKLPCPLAFQAQTFGETVSLEPAGVK